MQLKLMWVLGLALCVTSCGKDKASATDGVVSGFVLDEEQSPVAGATVYITGTSLVATSNSRGAFKLTQARGAASDVVVAVQNAGFVKQSMRTQMRRADAREDVNFTLHKVGLSVPITLPNAGEAPAQVADTSTDGGATLAIPHAALIKADGTAASGNVTVDLTYFHPRQAASTMPIMLLAQNNNGPTPLPLLTFGMADISITQGNEELQVAPGATLGLDFNAILAHRTFVTDHAREPETLPRLYSANKETGLWEEEALMGSAKLTWDENAAVFKARLPHLSSWNIDGLRNAGGGCMGGLVQAKNAAGQIVPAANTEITVWLASRDEVGGFNVTTDGSGRYCIEPGVAQGASRNMVRYFVSARNNPDNSSMCNPLPNYCSSCVDTTIPNVCQICGLRDEQICSDGGDRGNGDIVYNLRGWGGCTPRVPCGKGSSEGDLKNQCRVAQGDVTVPAYQDSCPADQAFHADIEANAHCGGACFETHPVTLGVPVKDSTTDTPTTPRPTTTPTTTPPTTTPQKPTPPPEPKPKPCDPASKNTRLKGQSCIPSVDTCCPNDGSLVCEDYVCVPKLKK